jgi:hypothetical protein
MVDMTLCIGDSCDIKEECFRFRHLRDQKSNKLWPSVTDFSFDIFVEERRDCPYFIPVLSHD